MLLSDFEIISVTQSTLESFCCITKDVMQGARVLTLTTRFSERGVSKNLEEPVHPRDYSLYCKDKEEE